MTRSLPEKGARSHYLRDWRKARGLTQETLAALIGVDRTVISKVETEKLPYSQALLERAAAMLGCHPADLLTGPPEDAETLSALWRAMPEDDRRKALAILKAFLRD